jgi:hypothetical protein
MKVRNTTNLTGKTRYRCQFWTKKLVLQVQYDYAYDDVQNYGGQIEIDNYSGSSWRDATVTDLQELMNGCE